MRSSARLRRHQWHSHSGWCWRDSGISVFSEKGRDLVHDGLVVSLVHLGFGCAFNLLQGGDERIAASAIGLLVGGVLLLVEPAVFSPVFGSSGLNALDPGSATPSADLAKRDVVPGFVSRVPITPNGRVRFLVEVFPELERGEQDKNRHHGSVGEDAESRCCGGIAVGNGLEYLLEHLREDGWNGWESRWVGGWFGSHEILYSSIGVEIKYEPPPDETVEDELAEDEIRVRIYYERAGVHGVVSRVRVRAFV